MAAHGYLTKGETVGIGAEQRHVAIYNTVSMGLTMYNASTNSSRVLAGALLATTFLTTQAILPAVAQQSEALPAITVEGQAGTGVTTEGTDSYTTRAVTIGKDAQPIRYIPQSISVITRQRIEDQNMTTLEDAARRTPGLVVLSNDKGRSSIFSRGFEFDQFQIDGLSAPMSSIYGTQPDLAAFDRVEILRGPAGLFTGSGEPAGTINMARKRALDHFGITGSGLAGSWDTYRTEVDVTGPLTKSGNVRARVVGVGQDAGTFIDNTHNNVAVGYGTVEVDLTPQTTLSAVVLHQERDIKPHNGLPAYANGQLADVSRSTYSGANWNRFDNRTDDYLLELEHKFDNGGRAKAGMRYSDRDIDFKYAYGGGAISTVNGNYTMQAIARQQSEKNLTADAHISTPFALFGQTHNLLFGIDYKRWEVTSYQGSATSIGTNNIFNPNPNIAEPNIAFTTRTNDVPESYGAYGQLRLKPISQITVILGSRATWYENVTTDYVKNTTATTSVDGKVTPYVGLVVDLSKNVSAYAVYTDIFQPQPTNRTANNEAIAPRTGSQYEAGLKGEFFDGRLNASIAYFITHDVNRAIGVTGQSGVFVAAGEAEVKGIETEVTGRLMPGWEITASYTYTESSHLNTTASFTAGQVYSTWTPKHNIQLWSKYEFQDPTLRGLHVAGGVRMLSEFFAQSGTVRFVEDGYKVFDAQVGYKFNKHLEGTFTVTNLFDETYYSRTGAATTFNFYGEPRSFWLKLAAKN